MIPDQPRLWRSRWAAIGAAVAVTLGAGGLATTFASSAPSSLVAISPVRVLDTRIGGFGGSLTSGTPRLLDVTGTISTVAADGTTVTPATVVPDGASAIVANVTIVGPSTPGFVAIRPGTATGGPTTSSLNATAAGVVVPNAVTVELPTSGATAGNIQLWFQGTSPDANTHLLIDIVGYYLAGGSGPAGPAGPRGLSAWDTIPSGRTVTGEILYDESASNTSSDTYQVTLPALATAPLTNAAINFASDAFGTTVDDDPACTGTFTNPTAPPGKVCLYANLTSSMTQVSGRALNALTTSGFVIQFTPTSSAADTFMQVTWAYTAP